MPPMSFKHFFIYISHFFHFSFLIWREAPSSSQPAFRIELSRLAA